MGGRIAWFFAAVAPERVDKLVLMAPDGFAGPGREYGKTPKVPLVARLLPYVLPERLLRRMLARAYGDSEARRKVTKTDPGFDEKVWTQLAEMGLLPP